MITVNYCGKDYAYSSVEEMLFVVGADDKKRDAIADAMKKSNPADVSEIVGCCCVITAE